MEFQTGFLLTVAGVNAQPLFFLIKIKLHSDSARTTDNRCHFGNISVTLGFAHHNDSVIPDLKPESVVCLRRSCISDRQTTDVEAAISPQHEFEVGQIIPGQFKLNGRTSGN